MKDDIRIWEIEGSSEAAELVESRPATEQFLEDVLVRNPAMLMPGLTLVGRQTPTESGSLDLLGVDDEGRLVVFELKREKLSRAAVAQAIDYCSYVESLTEPQLADYIAEHSGKNAVDKIDDFETWYRDRYGDASLRPTRMVLVGLGADPRAHAMVEFLAERGVDIALVTFHGYQYGEKRLLARQVEGSFKGRDVVSGRRQTDVELRQALAERAMELGIDGLWQDAVKALSIASNGSVTKSGITFYLPKITLPDGVRVRGSHSVVIDQTGRIRVTFYPAAVHVCLNKFQEKQATIPFATEKPPNAPPTKRVSEQWYCVLDKDGWKNHKEVLIALAR